MVAEGLKPFEMAKRHLSAHPDPVVEQFVFFETEHAQVEDEPQLHNHDCVQYMFSLLC